MKIIKKNQLITGDTLAYRNGAGIISRIIEFGTKSKYSHLLSYVGRVSEIIHVVEMMILNNTHNTDIINRLLEIKKELKSRNKNECVFIESDFSLSKLFKKYFLFNQYTTGVKLVYIDELNSRTGNHDVYRSSLSLQFRANYIKECITEILRGREYDFLGLMWIAVVTGRKKVTKKESSIIIHNSKKVYCSELERLLKLNSGMSSPDGLDPSMTTPKSSVNSYDMFLVGKLVK